MANALFIIKPILRSTAVGGLPSAL